MSLEQPSHSMGELFAPRRVVQGTLVVVAVIFAFGLGVRLYLALFSLFIAIIIATAISPAVDWLRRRGLSRAAAVGVVYFAIVVLVVAITWLSAPLLIEQTINITAGSAGYYQSARNFLLASPSGFIQRLALQMPPAISLVPTSSSGSNPLDAFTVMMSYIGPIGQSIFLIIAVFLLAFFWTLERDRILKAFLWLAPATQRLSIQELIDQAELKVGAYLRGLVVLSFAVGALAFGGYFAIGLPYALLMGIIAGIFEALPTIGPIIGTIPAIIVALSVDPTKVIWVVAINIIVQLAENSFLVPRVMNKAVGVNPIVILLAVAAFGSLFGLPGALLAIPIAALIQLFMDRYVLGFREASATALSGRDALNVIRYETHEFVQDIRKHVRTKLLPSEKASDEIEDSLELIAQDLDALLKQAALENLEKSKP
jgi:predicted PurR-regulated permease PerM